MYASISFLFYLMGAHPVRIQTPELIVCTTLKPLLNPCMGASYLETKYLSNFSKSSLIVANIVVF